MNCVISLERLALALVEKEDGTQVVEVKVVVDDLELKEREGNPLTERSIYSHQALAWDYFDALVSTAKGQLPWAA